MSDDAHDDLFDRLRRGADGVAPRADAPLRLEVALARDRRRRAMTTGLVAAVVVLAVAASASLLAVWTGNDPEPITPAVTDGPTDTSTDVTDPDDDVHSSRPAKLFSLILGGHGRGYATRLHLVRGERVNAQFEWWPGERSGPGPYLSGIAIESYPDDVACEDAVAGAPTCTDVGDGDRMVTFEMPMSEAFYDPVNQAAPVADSGLDTTATLRGVTYLRADGLAVSAFVCACDTTGATLLDEPPVGFDQLQQVASDDRWVYKRAGS